jgi:hypothetical protein
MTAVMDRPARRDLHNASTHFAAALAGRCAFTHLASGRVCLLLYRHPGPCQLTHATLDDAPPGLLAADPQR